MTKIKQRRYDELKFHPTTHIEGAVVIATNAVVIEKKPTRVVIIEKPAFLKMGKCMGWVKEG